MATTVQEYVAERGINSLMHFTRVSNLDSIMARGLVPRNTLVAEGYASFNDQYRFDQTNAVCVTIGFPNYKMFHGCKKDHPDERWVVLVIRPAALWMLDCAFCVTNAASNMVTAIPLANRKGLAAMQGMYADWPTKARADLAIPDAYPTNPQAEVLMLNGVPRNYIMGIITLNEAVRLELLMKFPGVDIRAMAAYHRWRKDYQHW
ncbi:hypothetical protein GmRootV59_46240 [Variovorax sp. V59]|uniref:DarT ssDNA thymidine ADP-ribosyltransferase family protein n=1 Tax=unclassified Variovorax TaxID=663243 RepID=UPI0034E93607